MIIACKSACSILNSKKWHNRMNIQDTFLNHVRKNKTSVTVFLVNGVKLQGVVGGFDNFAILLRRDDHSQLIYKHAVSTIMPQGSIRLFEDTPVEAGD